MFETILSSSSNSVDKAIDKYQDLSNYGGSSDDSNAGESSSDGNTTDKYMSGVLGVPLEVLQEGLKTRSESGSMVGTSAPSSTVQDEEEEVVYSCAIGVASKTDDRKLVLLKKWYQIPDDLNPRLAVCGEWCC